MKYWEGYFRKEMQKRRRSRIRFAVFIPHVAGGGNRNKAFSYVICQKLLVLKAVAADVDASKANHCYLAQWEHFSSSCECYRNKRKCTLADNLKKKWGEI